MVDCDPTGVFIPLRHVSLQLHCHLVGKVVHWSHMAAFLHEHAIGLVTMTLKI